MKLKDLFRRKPEVSPRYVYSEAEMDEFGAYIEETFGHFDNVFHEIVSPDIHLDVIIIPPGKEPFIRLVTMGAGAYAMNIPKELVMHNLKFAEYIITLPADWDLHSSDEKDYWPIRILKSTARVPVASDSWLGRGHTIHGNAEEEPFAENTKLNSIILFPAVNPETGEEASAYLPSSGKKINIY